MNNVVDQPMRYCEAVEMMRDGYRVARTSWKDGTHLRFEVVQKDNFPNPRVMQVKDGKSTWFTPTANDLLDQDWILVGYENREE